MKFVAAFNALGYQIKNKRQDWSAEKADGICISLWSKRTNWKSLVMDTRAKDDISVWDTRQGNKKRILHARRALDEFDGWIDVVKIDGIPGEGYGTASPWLPDERRGLRWRVTFLDDTTGHIRLEAQKP